MAAPVLYSFRRCPYAMRARMALRLADVEWEHREVDLKNKPQPMLKASPKGTVPVLILEDGTVIDESLDIMLWALRPDGSQEQGMLGLISENDGFFKGHLDRYKYPSRFEDALSPEHHRAEACAFLQKLEDRLTVQPYLFGPEPTWADLAIFPFIRQFSRVEADWFAQCPYPRVREWLVGLVESPLFKSIMVKDDVWKAPNP